MAILPRSFALKRAWTQAWETDEDVHTLQDVLERRRAELVVSGSRVSIFRRAPL